VNGRGGVWKGRTLEYWNVGMMEKGKRRLDIPWWMLVIWFFGFLKF
jgi:hypothetical protein